MKRSKCKFARAKVSRRGGTSVYAPLSRRRLPHVHTIFPWKQFQRSRPTSCACKRASDTTLRACSPVSIVATCLEKFRWKRDRTGRADARARASTRTLYGNQIRKAARSLTSSRSAIVKKKTLTRNSWTYSNFMGYPRDARYVL